MFRNIRLLAVLAMAAPLPVLVALGLRDPITNQITPAGATITFALAILVGVSLFRLLSGLMRIPLILVVLALLAAATAGLSI